MRMSLRGCQHRAFTKLSNTTQGDVGMTSHVICQGSDFEELPLNICAVGLNDWWIAGYSEALMSRRIGITNAILVADLGW
jgi:hypothetical protein